MKTTPAQLQAIKSAAIAIQDACKKLGYISALSGQVACLAYGGRRLPKAIEVILLMPGIGHNDRPTIDAVKLAVGALLTQSSIKFTITPPTEHPPVLSIIDDSLAGQSSKKSKKLAVEFSILVGSGEDDVQPIRTIDGIHYASPEYVLSVRFAKRFKHPVKTPKLWWPLHKHEIEPLLQYLIQTASPIAKWHLFENAKILAHREAFPQCAHNWEKVGFDPTSAMVENPPDIPPVAPTLTLSKPAFDAANASSSSSSAANTASKTVCKKSSTVAATPTPSDSAPKRSKTVTPALPKSAPSTTTTHAVTATPLPKPASGKTSTPAAHDPAPAPLLGDKSEQEKTSMSSATPMPPAKPALSKTLAPNVKPPRTPGPTSGKPLNSSSADSAVLPPKPGSGPTSTSHIPNPSPIQATLMAAQRTIEVLALIGLPSAIFGGLACFLYGNTRAPNEVDIIALPGPGDQRTVEEVKDALMIHDPDRFFILRVGNYKFLYYRLPGSGLSTKPLTSCKVTLVYPGTLSLPRLLPCHIHWNEGLPLIPFSLLLLQKLQHWDHHCKSSDKLISLKQRIDAEDIKGLFELDLMERLKGQETWMDERLFSSSFLDVSGMRARAFCREFPETTQIWRSIGFPV